jgi:hypothetical protein
MIIIAIHFWSNFLVGMRVCVLLFAGAQRVIIYYFNKQNMCVCVFNNTKLPFNATFDRTTWK